jgi:glutaredoxin
VTFTIYTRDNCVPCVRLKQWLADAKRDNKYNSVIHTFLHSIQFINIDKVPEKKGDLFDLGVKSVPCMIVDFGLSNAQHIGLEEIIERLERQISIYLRGHI